TDLRLQRRRTNRDVILCLAFQCVYERCIDEIISRLSCQNFAAILFCASRINCRRLVKASRQFANSLAGGAVAGKMLQLLERWWSSASSGLSFSSVSLSASPEQAASPRGRRSRDGSPCSDEDIVAIHPEGSILLKPLGAGDAFCMVSFIQEEAHLRMGRDLLKPLPRCFLLDRPLREKRTLSEPYEEAVNVRRSLSEKRLRVHGVAPTQNHNSPLASCNSRIASNSRLLVLSLSPLLLRLHLRPLLLLPHLRPLLLRPHLRPLLLRPHLRPLLLLPLVRAVLVPPQVVIPLDCLRVCFIPLPLGVARRLLRMYRLRRSAAAREENRSSSSVSVGERTSSPLSLLRRSPASAPSRPRKKLRSALEEGTCGAFETDEWAEYQWLESECSGGRSKGKEDDCSACTQRCCSRRGFVEEGQLGLLQTEEISMGSSKSLQDTLSSSSRNLCRNSAHNSSSVSSFVSSSTSSSPCSSSRSSSTSVSSSSSSASSSSASSSSASSSSASSSSASSSSASSSSLGHSGEALHAAAASQEFRGESDRRGSSGDQTGGAFHDACSTSSFSETRSAGDGTFPHCSPRPCRFWRGTACSSAPRLCQSSCSLPVLSLSPRSGELSSEKDWLSAKRSLSLPSVSASDASVYSSSAPRSLTEAHAHAASPSPRRQMETALSVGTHEEGTTRFLSPETTSSPSLQSPPSGEGDASRAVASATSCMSPSGTQAEEIAPEPHSKRDSERETLSESDAGGSCEKSMNHGSTETGCEIRGWTEVEKRQNATTCDALAADGCTPSQGRSDRGQPQESGVCSSRGVHTAKRRRHSDGGGTQTSAESVDSFRERSTLQSDCPTAGNQCESRVFGPEKDLGGTERGNCQDAAETNQLLLSESLFGGLVGEPHENDLRKENASPRRESPRCKKQRDARDHREPLPRQRATVGLSSCSSSDSSSASFPSSLSPSTSSSCLSYSPSPSSSLSASTSSSSFSASSSSSSSLSELKTHSALRSPLGGLSEEQFGQDRGEGKPFLLIESSLQAPAGNPETGEEGSLDDAGLFIFEDTDADEN
ncbi:BTB/POZ domain-containing protein, partial [Toxoplasma gondii FOU]